MVDTVEEDGHFDGGRQMAASTGEQESKIESNLQQTEVNGKCGKSKCQKLISKLRGQIEELEAENKQLRMIAQRQEERMQRVEHQVHPIQRQRAGDIQHLKQ